MKRTAISILIVLTAASGARAQFSRTSSEVELRLSALQREVAPLYRKPTGKEQKAVAPSAALREKYAEFLRRPDTGLTKLISDKGCAESTKVVVATADCLKYTMPGAGSSFSFRTENYRLARLADLTYTDQSFQATGVLLHGVFVNLGDVPVEQVTLETAGLKFLRDFQPEIDYEKAKEIDRRLAEGIREDGFLYRRALFARENTTFALRSIAYGGRFYRVARGIAYNELDFDRRRDVLVAFRVVEREADESLTILWKVLRQQDAPSIRKDDARIVKP